MCSRGEKEKDRKREEMEREEGNVHVQLSFFFRKTHMARSSHKHLRTTQRQLFSFTTVVFINFAYLEVPNLRCRCKIGSENGSKTSSEYFYISFTDRISCTLFIIHLLAHYNVSVTQKCFLIISLIFS